MNNKTETTKEYTLEEIERARVDVALQDEIIKQFYPLAFKMASKFHTDVMLLDFDDRIQIGLLSILEAINTYDGSTKFITHATNRIRFGLSNERRKQCSTKNFGVITNAKTGAYESANVLSLDADIVLHGEGDDLKHKIPDNSQNPLDTVLEGEKWDVLYGCLDTKELDFFNLIYFEDKTQMQTAKALGTSQTTVRHRLLSGYNKIKKRYKTHHEFTELMRIYQ